MKKLKKRRFRVALAYQTVLPNLERITAGVLDYARRHGAWDFAYSPEASVVTLESLASWTGDGVLTTLELPHQRALARKLNCPVVNLSGAFEDTSVTTVLSDNRALGRLAAEHFRERGFSRFAYYGLRSVYYSQERMSGFVEHLRSVGFDCSILLTESSLHTRHPWQWNRRELERWLLKLPTPVGVFAVHDYRGRMVLEACADLKLEVPNSVAVIGINDDPVACISASPPLTSIPQDGLRIGQAAAEQLHRLMLGEPALKSVQKIAPLLPVPRQSTDTTGVAEPRLRLAIAFIQREITKSFGIDAVAESAGLSKRRLEQLFQESLRCSPHAYIRRYRVRKAQELRAAEPKMKLRELARRCGFHDARRMRISFQSVLKKPQSE